MNQIHAKMIVTIKAMSNTRLIHRIILFLRFSSVNENEPPIKPPILKPTKIKIIFSSKTNIPFTLVPPLYISNMKQLKYTLKQPLLPNLY